MLSSEERTNYPVTVSVDDLGEDFQLTLQVMQPLSAQRLCDYLRQTLVRIIQALEQAPQTPAWSIEVLSEAEQQQMLVEWNRAPGNYHQERGIHELFEAQVQRAPDATALVHAEEHLSYAQLNERANRLAHYLRQRGVGPDVKVALCAQRDLELVVSVLAVLKAGGAYVPLDPAYPPERLAFMLRDCEPAVLLIHAELSAEVRAQLYGALSPQVPVVDLQADAGSWSQHSPEDLEGDGTATSVTARHLAYVIYTSGSTGEPKGVMVEHGNVTRLLAATQEWFHFDEQDVWSLFHSCAFDFSVWELWGALLHGGKLVVVPSLISRSPREFYQLLCSQGVTVLNQTPSAFRQLMAVQAQGDVPEHRLRYVIFGGEALEVSALRPWYEQPGNEATQLINMYGITETTVHVTYRALQAQDTGHTGASPIGKRIPDLRIYLLDGRGRPVPVGVEGEIYVGGAGVARGYLNRPELTAQRFVRDPFVGEAAARMYRTGDLGRYLADGSLEYLGRNDQQVKIRGFRIELGEIEARLQEQPGIGVAVVVAREQPDVPGDKRLVAYYTLTGDESTAPDAAGLRSRLAASLPEYMVPAAYMKLAVLPLTPNGKLDRRALPAPEGSAYGSRAYEAAVGEIETALAQVWAEVLRLDRVGRHDNFFELGGHSLLIIQMIERLRQLGLRIEVSAIYKAPTLEALAGQTQRLNPLVSRYLTAIRSSGSRLPLFLMHETSGEVLCYAPISRYLGEDLPIYGLRTDRDDAERALTIEMLAERYVSVVRSVQPGGPYRLAGWSAGGVLAYEMARQLLNEGERIEFLGLIDSGVVTMSPRELARLKVIQAARDGELRAGLAAQRLMDESASREAPTEEDAKWGNLLYFIRGLHPNLEVSQLSELQSLGNVEAAIDYCQQVGWLPSGFKEELLWRGRRTWNIYRAFAQYRPQPLSALVYLFTADTSEGPDVSQLWQAIAGERLRIEPIGGNHRTLMLEPYVQKLATSLQRRLADVEERRCSGRQSNI
jgi:amino acid adenylation domain-containing protein